MYTNLVYEIASDLNINSVHAVNAVQLLFEEEATVPFVARYRKEQTGSMNDITLLKLRDRYKYILELEKTKERYLKLISERAKVNSKVAAGLPSLKEKFASCRKKNELEDLYLPFKVKRQSRAATAKNLGAGPLLDSILENACQITSLEEHVAQFLSSSKDHKLNDADHALQLAADILAEQINEDHEKRKIARDLSFETGILRSEENEKFVASPNKSHQQARYNNYFDYQEPIEKAASHRIMAVRRGEADRALKVRIEVEENEILGRLEFLIIKEEFCDSLKTWFSKVVKDAYKRLMKPSIETEIRLSLKSRAEEEAISVFNKNLRKLLLINPMPNKVVMGVDPGLRSGSKIAIISETGSLLDYTVIHFNSKVFSDPKNRDVCEKIVGFIKKHKVSCIAIGNGTGSREVGTFLNEVLDFYNLSHVQKVIVNEAGASVYSTEKIAQEEFPDLDPVIRSAVSIGRRLQDPLAELVKIDPKSVGIGQYQHDCTSSKLNESLHQTVEYCVNRVGVNINTSSYKLLENISGINNTLAKNIVKYRDENGSFKSREDLKRVKGFTDNVFKLSAGFLRVVNGSNILDSTAIHPERYELVHKIAKDTGMEVSDLAGNRDVVKTINLSQYVDDSIGLSSLLDIAGEMINPGRDPRSRNQARKTFSGKLISIKDLKIGMSLKGSVSNVTNFGVFVDIGVHQDGLIHISEIADVFVKDPSKVLSVGDLVNVRVLNVDYERKRISLTCRSPKVSGESEIRRSSTPQGSRSNPVSRSRPPRNDYPRRNKLHNPRQVTKFSADDLMNKFNSSNSNN